MKQLKHPATIIAALALFLAIGGGAYAAATGLISGSQIKNNSIPAKKLTKGAIKSLHGQKGAAGPGGKLLTWDTTAVVGSPAPTTIGTLLGVTYAATCVSTAGNAVLTVVGKTPDGSWKVDYSYLSYSGGVGTVFANDLIYVPGTLSNFTFLDSITAASGGAESDRQVDFIQLDPSPGSMIWHETAVTTNAPSASCHLSMQAFAETHTAVAAAAHAPAARGRPQIGLGPR